MTDPATITGGPSEEAVAAAAAAFRDAPEDAQAPWRNALSAAYAVDEPRIRADERQITLRDVVEWLRGERFDPDFIAEFARKFGASA